MDISKLLDRYVIQARVIPVLLVVFPLTSLVVVHLPAEGVTSKLASGFVSLVLLSLLAQVGRDAGKKREPELFRRWGGKPSVRKLRHRDSDLPWISQERLRTRLSADVGISCPTKAEEEGDPESADEVYSAYVDHLREATRGDAILLSENISYGFRRNLSGMRSAGILAAAIGIVGTTIGLTSAWGTSSMVIPGAATAINAVLLALWFLRVNDDWIRDAAEAYADRLVRAYLGQKEEPASNAA